MLRNADKQQVQDVLTFLQDADVKPYLGGGVVRGHLFDGSKDYNDIDILGVSNIDNLNAVITHIEMGERVNNETESNPIYRTRIGNSNFLAKLDKLRRAYLGIYEMEDVAHRVELIPDIGKLERFLREKFRREKAPIDLSLTFNEHFEKNYGSCN